MKIRLYLYSLLIVSVLTQVILTGYVDWFPDVILLMVVFTGIFRGRAEGLGFGFVAGFLRGCFSARTLPLDVLLFPMVGAMSSMLARMFYRQNPVAQVFATAGAAFTVIASHVLYLNAVSGNDIGVLSVLLASWKHLMVTIAISPFAFAFLKRLLRLEE